MTRKVVRGLLALALTALATLPALAQSEVKEKPPMYSYVGVWNIPRPQWSEMEKDNAANQKVLEKALANGTIIAYGEDLNLIHQNDGWTAQRARAVLSVRQRHVVCSLHRHPPRRQHLCEPLLQLALWFLERRLHASGHL